MAKKTPTPPPKRTAKGQFAKGAVGNPDGGATKYLPEFAERAFRFCLLRGGTDEQLAEHLGVAERTVKNWYSAHPEFGEAVRRGKALADGEVAASLYERARGFRCREQQAIKVREITYADNGKKLREVERVEVVDVERCYPPDTVACIFWLKNRASGDWRDKIDHEHGGKLTLEQLVAASGQVPTEATKV